MNKQQICEKNCPDYKGMNILHKQQCNCSCHSKEENSSKENFTKWYANYECEKDCPCEPSADEISDWWLALRNEELKELAEETKEKGIRPILGGILGPQNYQRGYNFGREEGYKDAIEDVLSIINNKIQ